MRTFGPSTGVAIPYKVRHLVLWAAPLLGGCAQGPTARPPLDPAVLPEKLDFYVGSYIGGGLVIECSGETVTMRHLPMVWSTKKTKPHRVRPSAEHWRAFWRELADQQVFQWWKVYPIGGDDGIQWKLEISYRRQQAVSGGDNSYPTRGNVKKATFDDESLRKFEGALERLIGHPLE